MPDFDMLNPPKRITDPIHYDPKHPHYVGMPREDDEREAEVEEPLAVRRH